MKIVLDTVLGESPPETLAATFNLKLGGRSCICRGCYLNCLSIDLSHPEEANQPCAYLVNDLDRCIINEAASRAGRIPKFLIDKFTNPADDASGLNVSASVSEIENDKQSTAITTPVTAKVTDYSDVATSFVHARPETFRIDVSSMYSGEIEAMQDALPHCSESKKCCVVHEVGSPELPENFFLRITSTDLEATVEVYQFLLARRGLLCSVDADGFIESAANSYHPDTAEIQSQMQESQIMP